MRSFWFALVLGLLLAACGGDPDLTRDPDGSVVIKLRPGDGAPAWGERAERRSP